MMEINSELSSIGSGFIARSYLLISCQDGDYICDMYRTIILHTSFALCLFSLHAQAKDSARSAMTVGRYDDAISLLIPAVHRDSNLADMTLLAQCYQQIGNNSQSKILHHSILRDEPDHINSVYALSQIYQAENNWPLSIKYHRTLLRLDSTNATYHRMYAEQLIRVQEVMPALIHSATAYKLRPTDVNIGILYAKLLASTEQETLADSILHRLHELHPDHVVIRKELARTRFKLDVHDEVIALLESTALMIDLEDPYVKMLGFSYFEQDSFVRCIKTLSRLMDAQDEEIVHHYLARAFAQMKKYDEANFHYDRAIITGTSQRMDNYYIEHSRSLQAQGRYPEAITLAKRGYYHLDDARLLLGLAGLCDEYYADKKIALRYYKQYLKHDARNPILIDDVSDRIKYLQEQIHLSGR